MSEVKWTNEQKQAIETDNSNLLVAAAAGSGKTAVLVERIIHKIIDKNIDIDKMLVVTFTNAAASEMRERILEAIYKKIEEEPNNIYLQRQITLLNKASICTIDSFCLDIIRNYFYELDISANFQIGNDSEMELLKKETIDELFEEKYEKNEKDFIRLIDTYANYRGDENLKELILKIYNQIQSNPFPKKWLEEKTEMFNIKNIEEDFSNTIWGKIILNEILEIVVENKLKLQNVLYNLGKFPELDKYIVTISNDINEFEKIEELINKKATWEQVYIQINEMKFDKWPADKKITLKYKETAKEIRDKVKKSVKDQICKIMNYTSKEANEAILEMYPVLNNIKNIVFEFDDKFQQKKKERNKIDFHDIEHFALKILVNVDEKGNVVPTKIAKELQEKFEEIAIDEYQDSNLVQEYLLNSVSKQNNIFMVGDIKQSIYSFRQARPKLFLDKYKNYDLVGTNEATNGQKIKLFKNFRSREQVLNFTNWVFEQIMSEELGDVNYNEEEYLNLGAMYEESKEMLPELHILDLDDSKEDSIWKNEDKDENEDEIQLENENETQVLEKTQEEAKMVADRIEELFKQNFIVSDRKKGKRRIEYRDIAILLRATSNVASIYEKELSKRNIPVFCDSIAEYLESTEIQTILDLLRIIDNPMQDIPLVHILRSPIGNFTDNELLEIRLSDSKVSFYETMLKARVSKEGNLRNKIEMFLDNINEWKNLEKEVPLNEFIWKLYSDTNYYNYVGLLTNGNLRQANLKMLFERAKEYERASFKGLYNFINFIDKLKTSNKDLSAAKIIGENDNVVRIMSIHKSKGLEFPVVFLSNTGKQLNKKDLTESILLHQDLGFGPKFIDEIDRIEYSTLAREAIKLKLENELISEEMRVLYVALTRAKEKLIITGTCKNFEQLYKDKRDLLTIYQNENKENDSIVKLPKRLIRKCYSYLDWIILLTQNDTKQNKISLHINKVNRLKKGENIEETNKQKQSYTVNEDLLKKIEDKLSWKYPQLLATILPNKTSVSKVKEKMQGENDIYTETTTIDLEKLLNKTAEHSLKTPNFIINEEEKISSARKGTLIHLCLEKLDVNKNYNETDLKELVNDLVHKQIILQKEAEIIPISILQKYIKSDLWSELKQAKEIYKEKPFYLNIEANRIDEKYPKDERILLQGIIDLYYINKNGELILVDYKTDYIEKGEEQKLIIRYKEQLDLYKEALEKTLCKKVDKTIIYSTWLGKIEIK